jgi:hypothetical protein
MVGTQVEGNLRVGQRVEPGRVPGRWKIEAPGRFDSAAFERPQQIVAAGRGVGPVFAEEAIRADGP